MSVHGPDRPTGTSWTTDRFAQSIAAIAVLQAIWLWASIKRGWYLQSDISNLADSSGRSLDWDYLRSPLGGHFAPVLRAAYWLLQAVDPMSYELTIVLRLLLQAGAILVLGRILTLLVGRRPIIVVVLAGFSMSSLTLPGASYLTTGLAFGIAQLLCLASMLVLIRFVRTGRLVDGLLTGVLIGLATLASEQFVLYSVLDALLALGFCYPGTARERTAAALRHWRGWLAIALPVLGAVIAALAGANTKGAGGLRLGDVWPLLRTEWLRAIGPALVGGPFRWFGDPQTYTPFYAPADGTILAGQFAFVLLVLLGWYFTGRRMLLAWSLPVVAGVIGMLLVAAARYGQSGLLIPITPRYSYVVAAPLAMAICLSLSPDPADSQRRLELRLPSWLRGAAPATALLGVLLVIATCVSSVRYNHFWSRNPGRSYAETLAASVRTAGPKVNLFDTPLPPALVSTVEPNHHVSDLLRLLGVPATFDAPGSAPLLVTGDGRLVKATFLSAATAAGTPIKGCGTHLKGTGPFEIPLSKAAHTNEWFLRLELYQQVPSTVRIQVVDKSGRVVSPHTGPVVALPKLAALNLRLPSMSPATVRIATTGTPIDVCLAKVLIGGPFAAAGS